MFTKIFQEITPRKYYSLIFGALPSTNTSGEVLVKCPFHDDRESSLSINLRDQGGLFCCHGCGAGGNYIQFHQKYNNISELGASAKALIAFVGADISTLTSDYVDDAKLLQFQLALKENIQYVAHLKDNRGLSEDVIRRHELGMETRKVDGRSITRITIPIRDAEQNLVNIRRWLPEFGRLESQDHARKVIGMPGHNDNVLFPIDSLQQQQIFLCEGELDCLMLHSHGFNTLTCTAGVNNFHKKWYKLFTDKDVILLFDNDEAGIKAANELTPKLYNYVRSIRIVVLNNVVDNKDVTDLWKENKKDFRVLLKDMVASTPPFNKISEFDGEAIEVNLYQAARDDLIGKKIRVRALVAGKEDRPFAVPKRIRLTCNAKKKECERCPGTISDGMKECVVPPYSKFILQLLTIGRASHIQIYREIFGTNCKIGKDFEVLEEQNIEEIRLIPDIDMGSSTVSYTIRQAYYVGFDLDYNQLYDFTGITTIDPRNNAVTHVFWEAELVHKTDNLGDVGNKIFIDDVEAPVKEHLKAFQPRSGQTIFAKLKEIYADFEYNVTGIVKRQDIIQAIDITYHSPLAFHLGQEFEKKGWIDTLILGDTHCGKTRTMKALREHFHAGEVYDGTHISVVGIIGGYISLSGSNRTRYVLGVWPLNDKRLICLDELSGMDKESFGQLTSVRSEGVAESTKQGQRNRFPARVRFICLSNPRNNKAIPDYPYGVVAVKELIGEDADISRYDIVMIAAGNEVKHSDINNRASSPMEHIHTSELCNLMIRWAWSRKPTNIKISEEALELIQKSAQEMAETYSGQIPIVLGQSQRKKIARVAIAIATRLFSTEDGENVIVLKDHVEAALKMFHDFYTKPSMGYHLYSASIHRENTLPNIEGVIKLLNDHDYMVYEYLISNKQGTITRSDLAAYSGAHDMVVAKLFKELIRYHCIRKKNRDYKNTPAFLDFLIGYSHPRKDDYFLDNVDISRVEIE